MSAADRSSIGGPALGSVVEAIGGTPSVVLDRLTAATPGRIVAKLDYLNPGSSKKDRIARQLIEDAEQSGELRPGQVVVELTSGNTGTGLAIVCAVKGYPFVAVISEGNTAERARMMRALGAEVVLVSQSSGGQHGQVSGDDLSRVDEEANRIAAERDAFRADQFARASNSRAHELTTGPELWAAAGGRIDAFCEFVGTGGTFAGVARALRARDPAVACYVVEPGHAAALGSGAVEDPRHRIQGGGYAMTSLPLLEGVPVDGYLRVEDDDAIAMARRLAREEGIFGGFSSGANVHAALGLLSEHPDWTVAVVLADSGLKYLSTDLWA
jgi:cysteine synthase A